MEKFLQYLDVLLEERKIKEDKYCKLHLGIVIFKD
jgi:hypothetical protein